MSLKTILLATAVSLTALPALAFGPQDYAVHEVTLRELVGRLDVKVDSTATKVTASVTGPQRWVDRVTVEKDGDELVIHEQDGPRERSWKSKDDWVTVTLTVPAGTKLAIDGFSGEGDVGDLRGILAVEGMNSGKLKVGRVSTASISIDGSGEVKLGDVDRDIGVEINGSGSVLTGRTAGKTELEINGSGEVTLAAANGPINAEINGSGDIKIQAGVADPLAVEINGSGSLLLDGVARSQSIEQSGSGTVKVTGKAS